MNDQTRKALDWLMVRWPDQSDVIRSYPMNMVLFIARMCAEYHTQASATPSGEEGSGE